MQVLRVLYPELPPSSNKIYFQGTRLTGEARAYGERFSHHVLRYHLPEVNQIDSRGVFALHLRFYFQHLLNEGAFHSNPEKRTETLYKKLDLSNRVKLLEDCVRDLIAIDDSQTFAASQEKILDQRVGENGLVEIIVQKVDPTLFGLPPQEVLNEVIAGLKPPRLKPPKAKKKR